MADFSKLKVHPVADEFPLLEGDEFADLVADIAKNGLLHPIVLAPDGITIVDGRHRYLACDEAQVDANYITLGSHYTEKLLVDYIISANLRRRHLNEGQKAMLALKIEAHFAALARQRQAHGETTHGKPKSLEEGLPQATERATQARDRAGAAVGVSGRTVSKAKKVQSQSPELLAKVQEGSISLERAYKIVRARERRQDEETAAPAQPATVQAPIKVGDEAPAKASRGHIETVNEATARVEDRDAGHKQAEHNPAFEMKQAQERTGFHKRVGAILALLPAEQLVALKRLLNPLELVAIHNGNEWSAIWGAAEHRQAIRLQAKDGQPDGDEQPAARPNRVKLVPPSDGEGSRP